MIVGVAYLHAHLICHLDLSLENLLMDDSDNLKMSAYTSYFFPLTCNCIDFYTCSLAHYIITLMQCVHFICSTHFFFHI